eukprot:m.245621 g.245621  ORF g.245621 m.245621 type:complete len:126 (-) comp15365_c1_seq56:310-687(-)
MTQWTMGVRPYHPITQRCISDILHLFRTKSDEEIFSKSVVRTTGPAMWTDAVTSYLNETFNVELGSEGLSADELKTKYILVGDVLLLPMRSFSVGSGGYMIPPQYSSEDQLVQHGFQGSWKAKHT